MSSSIGAGPGFDLPEEILAVMPLDPYEQLDIARKITSMAIASRVSSLESEVRSMREKVMEKDLVVSDLERNLTQLNETYKRTDSDLKIAHDDNMKLSKERDTLAATVKKLTRDLAKLETFKRQLMQSLNDDNSSPCQTVDIGTYDQSVPKTNASKVEEVKGRSPLQSLSDSAQSGCSTTTDASKQNTQQKSLTSYKTPRLTPTGTPKIVSTRTSPKRNTVACTPRGVSRRPSPKKASARASPKRHSVAGSPKGISRKASPTKVDYERHGSLSSWYPSSQQSSVANSPSRGRTLPARTPKPDGKEFFHQARSRLSYEQFSAFLANIKELNAQKQSREDTLRKAEEIFGKDNNDLYLSFQGLLSRNVR